MGRYEWLDRDIGCVALDWDDRTSRHRPVAGYRKSRRAKEEGEAQIRPEMIGGVEWRRRVKLVYLEKNREADGRTTGLQKLIIVKEAVKQVSNQMIKEGKLTPLMKDASAKLA
eukprot:3108005-Heterocapsa_arctica.AAC.1